MMPPIDARAEYDALRAARGMDPHDPTFFIDVRLLEFYIAGTVMGMRNTLLAVKEQVAPGSRR